MRDTDYPQKEYVFFLLEKKLFQIFSRANTTADRSSRRSSKAPHLTVLGSLFIIQLQQSD